MKNIIIKLIKRFWILGVIYKLKNKLIRFLFISPRNSKIYNYFISNNEYARFIKAKRLNKKLFFIYDNSVSSPGFGDYLYFLYSIRSLIDKNSLTKVVITKSNFNYRWDTLILNDKLDYYINQQIVLFKKLLSDYNVELSIINSKELSSLIKKIDKDYIFFSSIVSSKSRLYNRLFNFINIVFKKTNSSRFLLKNSELISEISEVTIPKNYITIGFRYSNLWREESNNTSDQINRIINQIRLFSELEIVILSDHLGTTKCKEYLQKNRHISSIKFSKDFCSTFLQDGALLTNSRSYFQFKGGGLASFALFSRVPHLIYTPYNHELKFSEFSICAWAKYNQLFINSEDLDCFIRSIAENKEILFS